MIRLFHVVILIILCIPELVGQTNYEPLKNKLINSDSVILITYQSKGDSIQGLEYLLPEKDFFSSLIVKKYVLNKSELNELTEILTAGDRIHGRITSSSHYNPHQGILLYKKNVLSFIDINFAGHRIFASKDIEFDEFDMPRPKWDNLKMLFVNYGMIEKSN